METLKSKWPFRLLLFEGYLLVVNWLPNRRISLSLISKKARNTDSEKSNKYLKTVTVVDKLVLKIAEKISSLQIWKPKFQCAPALSSKDVNNLPYGDKWGKANIKQWRIEWTMRVEYSHLRDWKISRITSEKIEDKLNAEAQICCELLSHYYDLYIVFKSYIVIIYSKSKVPPTQRQEQFCSFECSIHLE